MTPTGGTSIGQAWRTGIAACLLLVIGADPSWAETRSLSERDTPGWQGELLDRMKHETDSSLPIADSRWLETLRYAVYDCWKPMRPSTNQQVGVIAKEYNDDCKQLEPRRSDLAWLLVRYEWDAYRKTAERARQEEAAWSLSEAVAEYRRVARASSEPLGQKLNRLRVALGYAAASAEQLSAGDTAAIAESEAALRKAVREEINAALALDKFNEDPMTSIAGPIVNMIRDVMATYLRAVDAEAVAKSLAVTVYGSGAALDASREALEPSEERDKLDPANITDTALRAWVVQATRERSEAVGIVQRYAQLKKTLWGEGVAQTIHANNLKIRTRNGPLNVLQASKAADDCELDRAKVASANEQKQVSEMSSMPSCIPRTELRRTLGPSAFDSLFHQHRREQELQKLLFQVAEAACTPNGVPFAKRTCALLREELKKANPALPDLKKSIDDLMMVSHLPYFADKDPLERVDPEKLRDPLKRETETDEQKMLYGRLAAALAADNATANSEILDNRITALKGVLERERVVAGVKIELGSADKDPPRIKELERDVRSVCDVVAAIDESLARSGLRRLAIPACGQSGESR